MGRSFTNESFKQIKSLFSTKCNKLLELNDAINQAVMSQIKA